MAAWICLSAVALIVAISIAAGSCTAVSTHYFYSAAERCGSACLTFFSIYH